MPTTANADDECRGNQPCQQTGGDADALAEADAASESNATATNNVTVGGTSSSANVTISGGPSDVRLRNVASPSTPNAYPSAPCRIAVSGGLSIAGGALSGGGSAEDVECTLRETVRTFAALGLPELGAYLMCSYSEVITGPKNPKRKGEEGSYLGTAECLRLVEELSTDADQPASGGSTTSVSGPGRDVYEKEHADIESSLADLSRRLDSLQRTPPVVVEQREVVERRLDPEKRSNLERIWFGTETKGGE